MNDATTLPDYDNPPVIEVVCGVLFKELEGLSAPHLGRLWDKLQPEYCDVREVAPLAPAIEFFGDAPPPQVRFTDVPPLARTWLMTPSQNRIVQVQRDRFLHNWKKVASEDEYPRYSKVIQLFRQRLETFRQFVDEFEFGPLQPIQYEMTYVNHIPRGDGWNSLDDVGSVFPDFTRRRERERFLPEPEQINWRTSFPLPQQRGRLHTVVRHTQRMPDKEPLFLFELTARGFPGDPSSDAMNAWFETAHEWIVRGFTDMTGEDVRKKVWRQTR